MGNSITYQLRGDSFGFPGPHCKDMGQPASRESSKYIWDANQTKRNMFGTTNNQIMFCINNFILSIPFLADDNTWKKAALDRQVAMRSNYRTAPLIGFDPFDTHWEWQMARKSNIFRPEMLFYNYVQFATDRIRLSQPQELSPGMRHPTSGFYNGVNLGYANSGVDSNINWDTSTWGASGVRVEK